MSVKGPYYKIYIEDRDITEYVESLDYEDAIKEDNLVTLVIDQTYALRLADDEDFITGKIISFQFGFMGADVSELHQARITDITHKYKERVSMTIKCLDKGTKIKKTTSQKIWENKTASDIANEIASKYGLDAEITSTSKTYENLPQGNRSDLEFLQYLAKREGNGNFVVYIRNKTLYFVERGLKDDSKVTFTYGYGDGILVSFEPTLKESGQEAAGNQTAVTTVDDKTGEVKTEQVDNDNEEEAGTTGDYKIAYGADKGESRGPIDEDNTTVGKPNTQPVKDAEEAKSLANATKKKASLGTLTAKLTIEGNPLLTPNAILTVKNVAKRHLGNWFITKVKHNIKGSAFVTICNLSSNGAKSKATSKDKANDANKTEGADKVNDEVKLLVVDGNTGKPQGYSSSSATVKKGS